MEEVLLGAAMTQVPGGSAHSSASWVVSTTAASKQGKQASKKEAMLEAMGPKRVTDATNACARIGVKAGGLQEHGSKQPSRQHPYLSSVSGRVLAAWRQRRYHRLGSEVKESGRR